MIFGTSEYIFINPIENELNNIIDNTILDIIKIIRIIIVEKSNLNMTFSFLII